MVLASVLSNKCRTVVVCLSPKGRHEAGTVLDGSGCSSLSESDFFLPPDQPSGAGTGNKRNERNKKKVNTQVLLFVFEWCNFVNRKGQKKIEEHAGSTGRSKRQEREKKKGTRITRDQTTGGKSAKQSITRGITREGHSTITTAHKERATEPGQEREPQKPLRRRQRQQRDITLSFFLPGSVAEPIRSISIHSIPFARLFQDLVFCRLWQTLDAFFPSLTGTFEGQQQSSALHFTLHYTLIRFTPVQVDRMRTFSQRCRPTETMTRNNSRKARATAAAVLAWIGPQEVMTRVL